jgi:Mg2+-importing ATPase
MDKKAPRAFWSVQADELLRQINTTPEGLTTRDAEERLARFGPNLLKPRGRSGALPLFLAQFKSPIILILVFAALLSLFLRDLIDTLIILTIVFISGLLGFWQEKGATNAVEKLLAIVQIKALALRDRSEKEIPVEEIVPGDVVALSAGGVIPGDCLILESRDFFVDEAA